MNKSLKKLLFEENSEEISKSLDIKANEFSNNKEKTLDNELKGVYPISFTSAKNQFNIVLSRVFSKLLKNPNILTDFEKVVRSKLPDADIKNLSKDEKATLSGIIKKFNEKNPNSSISNLNIIDKKELNGIDIKIINTSQKNQENDVSALDRKQISQTNIIPFTVQVDDKIVSFVKKIGDNIKVYNLVFFVPVIGNIVDFTEEDSKTEFLKKIFGEENENEENPIQQLTSIKKLPFVAVDSENLKEFEQTVQNAFKYQKSGLITRLLTKLNNRKGNINSINELNKIIEEFYNEENDSSSNSSIKELEERFVYKKGLAQHLLELNSIVGTKPVDIFGSNSEVDASSEPSDQNYKQLDNNDKDELNLLFKSLVMQSPGASTKLLEKTRDLKSQEVSGEKTSGGTIKGMAAGLAAGLGTMPFAQKGRLGVGSQQLKNQASQGYDYPCSI